MQLLFRQRSRPSSATQLRAPSAREETWDASTLLQVYTMPPRMSSMCYLDTISPMASRGRSSPFNCSSRIRRQGYHDSHAVRVAWAFSFYLLPFSSHFTTYDNHDFFPGIPLQPFITLYFGKNFLDTPSFDQQLKDLLHDLRSRNRAYPTPQAQQIPRALDGAI